MKKSLKKMVALASAVIMTLGMATTVFADEPTATGGYSITITGSGEAASALISGNTYALYKLADFTVSTLNGNTVYTNITAVDPFTSLQSDIEALNGKNYNDDSAVELAEDAAALIGSNAALTTTTNGSFSNIGVGYYLIVETDHGSDDAYVTTKYILVAVDGDETVYIKTSKAGVVKKIVSEHDSTGATLEDADTVAIGDTVTYQLDATIPTYDADATGLTYQLVDTLSSGLTYKAVTSVKFSTDGTTYSEADADDYEVTSDNGVVTITIKSDSKLLANKHVRVTLTAELNSSASTGSTGNPNSVHLTYTNNYYGTGNSTHTTEEDTVITYTGELVILKKDASSGNALSGAEFTIYRVATADEIADSSVTKYTIKINETDTQVIAIETGVTTGTDGKATVTGLDTGTYYAVETKAPDGYSKDETPQSITLEVSGSAIETAATGEGGSVLVTEDTTAASGSAANTSIATNYTATWTSNGNTAAEITNQQGTTLPGTGGIGTTLFTFGGLALVILAAVMFIVYTKKQRKQA